MTPHSGIHHKAAPGSSDSICPVPGWDKRPDGTHGAARNGKRAAVARLAPGAAVPCRSGRDVRELLAPDAPRHLLPIVEALLSGQTDEAASKRLGISPRTFSRRVAELLDHLNVATRFQGGVELVRRGCQNCFARDEAR
ncbi:Uncharacterised protein [Actinomadura madurae]|nr:Uncharacterised protein [Actinomadura madurae]